MSEIPHPTGDPRRIAFLAIIAITIPVAIGVTLATMIVMDETQTHGGDHELLVKIQSQMIKQNSSVNNITSFLVNQQLPFDQSLFKTNQTIHERLLLLENKK